jgi:hypothetical protein
MKNFKIKNELNTISSDPSSDILINKIYKNRAKNEAKMTQSNKFNTITVLSSPGDRSQQKLCKKINENYTTSIYGNQCGVRCRNIETLKEVEQKMKELLDSNDNFRKVNEHLMMLLNKKEELLLKVCSENFQMKSDLLNFKATARRKKGKSSDFNNLEALFSKIKPDDFPKNSRLNTNMSETINVKKNESKTSYMKLKIKDEKKGNESNRGDLSDRVKINSVIRESVQTEESTHNAMTQQISNKENCSEENEIKTRYSFGNTNKIPSFNKSSRRKSVSFSINPLVFDKDKIESQQNPSDMIAEVNNIYKKIHITHGTGNSSKKTFLHSKTMNRKSMNEIESNPKPGFDIIVETPKKKKSELGLKKSRDSFFIKEVLLSKAQHYERINDMTSRNQKRKYKSEVRMSFLSLNYEGIRKISQNEHMKELYNITLSDDDFISHFREASDDKLIAYCDIIGAVIKDYINSLKLIQRVQLFLKSSVNLVNSVLLEDSTTCLIRNACEILDCERTTLFVHDKTSDMLIVHSAEGLKKTELKVPKDKGIVGLAFMNGEKVLVHDAYQDNRFNKEVDRLTGFRTRNILCLPLKDQEGVIFGAIQSINKKGSTFNKDDEELMNIFSYQASAILKNSMTFDDKSKLISSLRMIINLTMELDKINNLNQFTLTAEDTLMSLFSTINAQFLFYNNSADSLVRVSKYHQEVKKKVGIINHVATTKVFYACHRVDDCQFYNTLADLQTGNSLVTVPIIDEKNKLKAVFQFSYNGKVSFKNNRIKEYDMNIVDLFIVVVVHWIRKKPEQLEKLDQLELIEKGLNLNI